jgi:hypothetical protein
MLAAEPGDRFGAPRGGDLAVRRLFHLFYSGPPAGFNPLESLLAKASDPRRLAGIEDGGRALAGHEALGGAAAVRKGRKALKPLKNPWG